MLILKTEPRAWRRMLAMAAISCLAAVTFGQSGSPFTITGQTSVVPAKDRFELKLDGRFFKGDENNTYIGANLIFGLGNRFALVLNGGFAPKKTQTFGPVAIQTGGNDVEVQGKYAVEEIPGLALSLGVSAPTTPQQSNTFVTARAVYGRDFEGGSAYAGVVGAFRSGSNISAITFGAESKASGGISFLGEYNLVLTGNNTYDTAGNVRRVSTYAIGARYRMPNDPTGTSILLGWTNALGSTTGFSLSPGLNNSGALYLGVSFSR